MIILDVVHRSIVNICKETESFTKWPFPRLYYSQLHSFVRTDGSSLSVDSLINTFLSSVASKINTDPGFFFQYKRVAECLRNSFIFIAPHDSSQQTANTALVLYV